MIKQLFLIAFYMVLGTGCADKSAEIDNDIKESKIGYKTFDYGISITTPKMLCRNYTKVKQNPIDIKGYINANSKNITLKNRTTNRNYQGKITKNGEYLLSKVSLVKGSNDLEITLKNRDNKQSKKEFKVVYETISIDSLASHKKSSFKEIKTIDKISTKVLKEVLQDNPKLYKKRLIEEFEKEPTVKKVFYEPDCVGLRSITVVFNSGVVENVNSYIPTHLLNPSIK